MAKILEHISHARDWLEKAEKKVRGDNRVEGEMFLSLAEAEIHKAWEDSIDSRESKKPSLFERLKQGKLFKFGLIIILISGLVFAGFNYYRPYQDRQREQSLQLNLPQQQRGREESLSQDLHREGVKLISNNLSLNN